MNRLMLGQLRSIRRGAHYGGFSLIEVLIAMGIFAVGFVAVAAMFPAAVMLQRETVADVEAQMVARNAAAMVRTRRVLFKAQPYPAGDKTFDLGTNSGGVKGLLEPFTLSTNTSDRFKTSWTRGDRGYPTAQQTSTDRKYYWVPFIRRTKEELKTTVADWIVVVFVMRREGGLDYTFASPPVGSDLAAGIIANASDGPTVPKVIGIRATVSGSRFMFNNRQFATTAAGAADQIRAGDFIADNNGVVYNVIDADSTGCTVAGGVVPTVAPADPSSDVRVWYAPPPAAGVSSPCVRVLLLTGMVTEAK